MELRFFSGLTIEELAPVLDRSTRTIMREWRLARAWLYRELRGGDHERTPPDLGAAARSSRQTG